MSVLQIVLPPQVKPFLCVAKHQWKLCLAGEKSTDVMIIGNCIPPTKKNRYMKIIYCH